MLYTRESVLDITEKYEQVREIRGELLLQMMSVMPALKSTKAKEYLMQGVGRRLDILGRCIENVFVIFPISRNTKLIKDELADLGINLHAFFVNVSGLLDNLGWVFAYETNLIVNPDSGKLRKRDIGLFNRKTQEFLPEPLRAYLRSERLKDWHSEYSKNYRDALAHRIPLYVPPAVLVGNDQKEYLRLEEEMQTLDFASAEDRDSYDQMLNKQKSLGESTPFFAHSLDEGCRPVMLHAQLICDYLTIEEIIRRFCDQLLCKE